MRYDNDCQTVTVRSNKKCVKAMQDKHAKAKAQNDGKGDIDQTVRGRGLRVSEEVTVNHDVSLGYLAMLPWVEFYMVYL